MSYEHFVKSKVLFVDQHDNIRIIKDKEYPVIREYEESYLIFDELDKEVVLSKENFYEEHE